MKNRVVFFLFLCFYVYNAAVFFVNNLYENNYALRHIPYILLIDLFAIFIHEHICLSSTHINALLFVKSALENQDTWEEGKRRGIF